MIRGKTDWLNSDPIFYNEKTLKISKNINDVIDFTNVEIDWEGFNNYLKYGYCVFERTPIKHVKFLRFDSSVLIENNAIKIKYEEDDVENWLDKEQDENRIWELLRCDIQGWEKAQESIILPMSGGNDSRILAFFLSDKSKVKAFTYGISDNQTQSSEVVQAKFICNKIGLEWNQIVLGKYNDYIDEWINLYGVSTHAHGMYHIEFYNKMKASNNLENSSLISGIVGDAWAGGLKYKNISSPADIIKLGLTHGMAADISMSNHSPAKLITELEEEYYELNKTKLQNYQFQVVDTIRHKMMLLSYLLRIPKEEGFKPYSPFLSKEIALSMLAIPPKRLQNRQWQSDFFERNNLLLNEDKRYDSGNTLNFQSIYLSSIKPLHTGLLREVMNPMYVEWINNKLFSFSRTRADSAIAYKAYLVLKPIEDLLMKRDFYSGNKAN